jgi:hypothetical protein
MRKWAVFATVGALTSCGQKGQQLDEKRQQAERRVDIPRSEVRVAPNVLEQIQDGPKSIQVLGGGRVQSQLSSGQLTKASLKNFDRALIKDKIASQVPGVRAQREIATESLYVQLPVKELGEGYLFGGVITKVSEKENETIGRLKLTDLPPIHVRPYLAADGDGAAVVLVGCVSRCSEQSAQIPLIGLPVVGMTKQDVVMDLSTFGEALDLMGVLDPGGEYSGYKTVATRTTTVDFSSATIIWDVAHEMAPNSNPKGPKIEVVARYFLKSEAGLNSAFVARPQVEGVGYFTTQRGPTELINRFSATEFNGRAVHYYIKDVPAEHKAAFAESFDDWNKVFKDEMGRELLSYEFVSPEDPRYSLLVPGDVRYNILEWDLVNKAPYGGLGPSVASQTTGEIFSANVLIQGPSIIGIYKEWFGVAEQVKALLAEGRQDEADQMMLDQRRKIIAILDRNKSLPRSTVGLGQLKFQVHGQDHRYEDPLAARQDFFALPDGESYESYMRGYFKDMVAHELGHNLGLRHNFKGNLFASKDGVVASSSIMEYLNREFRYKSDIGVYDRMAIKYGYAGQKPSRLDMFCTDEQVVSEDEPALSAECSRDDATNDPYVYLGSILQRTLDHLVARGKSAAPTWTLEDIDRELTIGITGLMSYASSAEAKSSEWIDWSNGERPKDVEAIKSYVVSDLKSKLCHPGVRLAANQKNSEVGKDLVRKNLEDIDARTSALAAKFGLGDALHCPTY